MFFILEQGRHSTKTSMLFIMLAITFSAVTLLAYANYVGDGNALDINGLGCAIACYLDSDCNDQNQSTIDICNNDASCESYCTSIAIEPECQIACSSDADCDDDNNATVDICNNDGTCEAECTSIGIEAPCEIACSTDTDCDDSNPETIDICNNDGTCEAECSSLPVQETKGKAIEKGHVLPSFSLKGLSGEKINYALEMINQKGIAVKSAGLPAAAEAAIPAGLYKIELVIDSSPVKKIVLENAAIDSNSNALELQMLPNTQTGKGKEIKNPFLLNPLSEFETGQIRLLPPAGTNAVVKCTNWDSGTNSCLEEWQTAATYSNSEEEISITISPEDPVFGFTQITIINVQSYPSVGGEWEVRFTTVGKADLTIKPVDGTTWSNENENEQLKFLDIKCGQETLPYQWNNGTVLVQDYECNETGYETSKVIMPGGHHLEFDFGGQKAYAHNQTDANVYNYLCDAMDAGANEDAWGDPCDGGPGPENEHLNFVSDALVEIHSSSNKFAGIKTVATNWGVGDCASIDSVTLYYKWWSTISANDTYYIDVSNDNVTWYRAVSVTNPAAEGDLLSTDISLVTSGIDWNCGNFTGTELLGSTAIIKSILKDSTKVEYFYSWDVLHIGVTYTATEEPTTCTCPTSGNWEINDGSVCTLSSLCNLPSGSDLHISSGSLRIDPNGTLVVPSGSEVVIKKATGNLFVDDGGKLVINK